MEGSGRREGPLERGWGGGGIWGQKEEGRWVAPVCCPDVPEKNTRQSEQCSPGRVREKAVSLERTPTGGGGFFQTPSNKKKQRGPVFVDRVQTDNIQDTQTHRHTRHADTPTQLDKFESSNVAGPSSRTKDNHDKKQKKSRKKSKNLFLILMFFNI